MNIDKKIGWSIDITNKNATHYYIDGLSLCKKAKVKFHMDKFHPEKNFSMILGFTCSLCSKKLEIKDGNK